MLYKKQEAETSCFSKVFNVIIELLVFYNTPLLLKIISRFSCQTIASNTLFWFCHLTTTKPMLYKKQEAETSCFSKVFNVIIELLVFYNTPLLLKIISRFSCQTIASNTLFWFCHLTTTKPMLYKKQEAETSCFFWSLTLLFNFLTLQPNYCKSNN